MKRILIAAALALLASTAHASKQLSTEGYWTTALAGTADIPVCVSMTELSTKSGSKGFVMLKGQKNGTMYFHIIRLDWKLPVGVDVPIAVSFDNGTRNATGRTIKTNPNENFSDMVEVHVNNDSIIRLLEDFSNSKEMVITFKDGNEPPWRMDLKGSRTAAVTLAQCVVKIGGNTPQASSPVTPPATSPVSPKPTTSPVAPARRKDDGSI